MKLTVIMWAIDYGVALHTSNLLNIHPLSDTIKPSTSAINIGCLAALPATLRFNFEKSRQDVVFQEQWTERAMTFFQSCIENSHELHFITYPSMIDGVTVGELIMEDNAGCFSKVSNKMIEETLAMTVPEHEFLRYYNRSMAPFTERWNDFKRSGGVLKIPEGVILNETQIDQLVASKSAHEITDSVYSETKKFSIEKVSSWKQRNMTTEQTIPMDFESFISSSSLYNYKDKNPFDSTKSSFTIGSKIEVMSHHFDSEKSSKVTNKTESRRKMILVPAGGQLHTENKKPATISEFSNSRYHTIDINELDDEQFVSVSQIGESVASDWVKQMKERESVHADNEGSLSLDDFIWKKNLLRNAVKVKLRQDSCDSIQSLLNAKNI